MAEEMKISKLPHDHGEDHIHIMDEVPSNETISEVAAAMKQLGDPSRLKIFWILCHCEECVINIAALTQMTSPAVSHHLRILKDSGLITSTRVGKEMYYKAVSNDLVDSLHHTIEEIARISCPSGQ